MAADGDCLSGVFLHPMAQQTIHVIRRKKEIIHSPGRSCRRRSMGEHGAPPVVFGNAITGEDRPVHRVLVCVEYRPVGSM